eukprot:4259729-Alexandrium_andersonii.AAC.1
MEPPPRAGRPAGRLMRAPLRLPPASQLRRAPGSRSIGLSMDALHLPPPPGWRSLATSRPRSSEPAGCGRGSRLRRSRVGICDGSSIRALNKRLTRGRCWSDTSNRA